MAKNDLWSRIYDEISDALDLLDNTTALDGSEDSLGQAELALVRAREAMIADGAPRLIAEAPAMLEALREFLCDQETMHEPYRNEAICERARAILARIDGAPTAQPAGAIGEAGAGVWRIITGTHCAELLYWSNAEGWGNLARSDAFTQAERESLNLPIGGQWWFDSDSPDECQTCTEATETRAFPCDECGHSDEYGDA